METYRKDLDYWFERQQEYQRALKAIQSKGEATESVWKLKGKLEAVAEMIAYLQRRIGS